MNAMEPGGCVFDTPTLVPDNDAPFSPTTVYVLRHPGQRTINDGHPKRFGTPPGRRRKKIAFIYRSNADHTLSIVDSDKEMQHRVLWKADLGDAGCAEQKIRVYANPQNLNDIYARSHRKGASGPAI
jgi:hypothetical protein